MAREIEQIGGITEDYTITITQHGWWWWLSFDFDCDACSLVSRRYDNTAAVRRRAGYHAALHNRAARRG